MLFSRLCHPGLLALFLAVSSLLSVSTVQAARPAPTEPVLSALATDLGALITQGEAVDVQLAGITLTVDNSCTELGSANTSVGDYLAAIETVYASIAAGLVIDTESLTSLDTLSNLAVSIAGRAQTLSQDLTTLSSTADLVEYEASLAAMLVLSDDIGSMANRIGEMANRILIMSDNIGLMADRILITQQLQNTNVALTQSALLATQQNLVVLSDSFNTLGYNATLAGLVSQGNSLSTSMTGISLDETNMDSALAGIELDMTDYLNQFLTLYGRVSQDSGQLSLFIDGDTLTLLGDLAGINRALAASLEAYASAINGAAPLTSTPVLSDATVSMLRLTQDIGIMSDRIIEMADRIIVMADNIGLMSTRIVDTQTLQQTNIDLTQASLLTTTSVTVEVIAASGL